MTLFARIIKAVNPKLSLQFPVGNRSIRTSTASRTSVELEIRNRSPAGHLPSMICVSAQIGSSFLRNNKVH
jgi:hypothetical protein